MRCFLFLLLIVALVSCEKTDQGLPKDIIPTYKQIAGTWGLHGVTYTYLDTLTGQEHWRSDTTEIDSAITFLQDTASNGVKVDKGDMYLRTNYLSNLLPTKGRWYFQEQYDDGLTHSLYFTCTSGCSDTAQNLKYWFITLNQYNYYGIFETQKGETQGVYLMRIQCTGPLGSDRTLITTSIDLWHK